MERQGGRLDIGWSQEQEATKDLPQGVREMVQAGLT